MQGEGTSAQSSSTSHPNPYQQQQQQQQHQHQHLQPQQLSSQRIPQHLNHHPSYIQPSSSSSHVQPSFHPFTSNSSTSSSAPPSSSSPHHRPSPLTSPVDERLPEPPQQAQRSKRPRSPGHPSEHLSERGTAYASEAQDSRERHAQGQGQGQGSGQARDDNRRPVSRRKTESASTLGSVGTVLRQELGSGRNSPMTAAGLVGTPQPPLHGHGHAHPLVNTRTESPSGMAISEPISGSSSSAVGTGDRPPSRDKRSSTASSSAMNWSPPPTTTSVLPPPPLMEQSEPIIGDEPPSSIGADGDGPFSTALSHTSTGGQGLSAPSSSFPYPSTTPSSHQHAFSHLSQLQQPSMLPVSTQAGEQYQAQEVGLGVHMTPVQGQTQERVQAAAQAQSQGPSRTFASPQTPSQQHVYSSPLHPHQHHWTPPPPGPPPSAPLPAVPPHAGSPLHPPPSHPPSTTATSAIHQQSPLSTIHTADLTRGPSMSGIPRPSSRDPETSVEWTPPQPFHLPTTRKGSELGLTLGHFDVLETLGTGTFGMVLCVKLREEAEQAAKAQEALGGGGGDGDVSMGLGMGGGVGVGRPRSETMISGEDVIDPLMKGQGGAQAQGGRGQAARIAHQQRMLASQRTGKFFAMKVLKKSEVVRLKQVEHIACERAILGGVRHEFIVNLFCTFQDERNLYMLLEFVQGGELFSHLRRAGRFTPDVTRFYAANILLAIEYLHSLDIIYRDLKPENLLLDGQGYIKITDFGFAKRVPDRTFTLCGTPEYLAPEVIQSTGHGKPADWWAFGVLLFEMLCGYPPFFDDNPFGIYQKIISGRYAFPPHVDAVARDLIKRLLMKDRTKRLGNLQRGSGDITAHPWFEGVSWRAVERREIRAPIIPHTESPGDTSHFERYPSAALDELPGLLRGRMDIHPSTIREEDPFRDLFVDF